MKFNRDLLKAMAIAMSTTAVVCGAIEYITVASEERAKRKKIEEWETMNIEAIRASRKRLDALRADPNATAADILKAWREEEEWMKLIGDQPMY